MFWLRRNSNIPTPSVIRSTVLEIDQERSHGVCKTEKIASITEEDDIAQDLAVVKELSNRKDLLSKLLVHDIKISYNKALRIMPNHKLSSAAPTALCKPYCSQSIEDPDSLSISVVEVSPSTMHNSIMAEEHVSVVEKHSGSNLKSFDGISDTKPNNTTDSPTCSIVSESRHNKSSLVRNVRFGSITNSDGRESLTTYSPTAHVGQPTPGIGQSATFTNPFRTASSSNSSASSLSTENTEYLRAGAFSGHRDTLARLLPAGTDNESSEEDDMNRLASVQTNLATLSSGAKYGETFAHIQLKHRVGEYDPGRIVPLILEYVSPQDHVNMLKTCRAWYRALPLPKRSFSQNESKKSPASQKLPTEVLHYIYSLLSPCDFDAARRTCQLWYKASSETNLVHSMLRKIGCRHAFQADLKLHKPLSDHDRASLMISRLSTECRISPDWRGSSFDDSGSLIDGRMHVVERINFSKLLSAHRKVTHDRNHKTFTVSACGTHVIVCVNQDLFLYELNNWCDTLKPVIRLVANANISRVSMDTSSGRYAVAALLDDYSGVLWDLQDSSPLQRNIIRPGAQRVYTKRNYDPLAGLPVRREEMYRVIPEDAFGYRGGRASCVSEYHPSGIGLLPDQDTPWYSRLFGIPFCSTPESESVEDNTLQGIPIMTKPSAKWSSLGDFNDVPKSVAICPQYKCVAFGGRRGIDFRWMSPATEAQLSRIFPISSPADYLFYMPRALPTSSKKSVRLISSAAGPASPGVIRRSSMPAKILRRANTHDRGRRSSMTRTFYGGIPFPSPAVINSTSASGSSHDSNTDDSYGVSRTVDCDHYHAVPLSDGVHVLFTDIETGFLCLGSDAPLDAPTKLYRKVMFVPPFFDDNIFSQLMTCYSAGRNLQWGIRIVAAHEDGRLVLYNVPSDCFQVVMHARTSYNIWDETAGVLAQSDLLMDEILSSQSSDNIEPDIEDESVEVRPAEPLRPVQIDGVLLDMICHDDVQDLHVDSSNGGLKVWVLCASGMARMYDLYSAEPRNIREGHVGTDGLIYYDANTMVNVDPLGEGYVADDGETYYDAKSTMDSADLKGKERVEL